MSHLSGNSSTSVGKREETFFDQHFNKILTKFVWRTIPPVATVLGCLYLLFLIGHLVLLPPAIKTVMAVIAGASALILFSIALLSKRILFSPRLTYPVAFSILALTVVNSLIHLFLTGDILQTTNLILVIFGAGFFLLSTPWFLLSLVIILTGWAIYVSRLSQAEGIVHFGIALFSASVISTVFHLVRTRTLKRVERLRLQSEGHLAEFKQAQETRNRFFQLSIDMLCIAGFDGYFKQLNPAFEQTLGFSEQELLSRPFLEFVYPEDRETTREHIQSLKSGRELRGFENRFLTKDGAFKWVLWNAAPFPDADLLYAIGHDITKQKESVLALQEREKRIQAILDTTADGIITMDEHSRIRSFNQAAGNIFGYSEEEVLGKPIKILMPEPERSKHKDYVDTYLRTREAHIIGRGREVEGIRKNGEVFPLALAVSQVDLPDRILFTGVIRDITQRKKAERALRQARERLQREIDLAAQIQTSLLPEHLPNLEGFDFAAEAIPARFVSGDFYDFFDLDQNTCQIVLGDMAGKGVSAALLASSTRSLLKSETKFADSVSDLLDQLNELQYKDFSQAEVFVTLFVATIDALNNQIRYASAGHGEALLWRHVENEHQVLSATGLPAGIFPDQAYQENHFFLRPGDVFLLFSDGVTEAHNPEEEQFGLQRLVAVLRQYADHQAIDLIEAILDEVRRFSKGHEQDDDISLIAVKALPRKIFLTVPGVLTEIESILAQINQSAAIYSSEFAYELELASSEILTNIVKHAYQDREGDIRVEIYLQPEGVELEFFDQGASFDFDGVPTPDAKALQESGYGLSIVGQLMDHVSYQSNLNDGNRWYLQKHYRGDNE